MIRKLCLCVLLAAILTSCGSPPVAPPPPKRDPTVEPWYAQTVADLTALNRKAKTAFHQGKSDAASALIQQGESLSARLLAVPRPTLAAAEAASDLDQLYGQMLLSNRNYGWARLMFQKNLARWKHWRPQTPDTAARLKQAESAIADCDRKMTTDSEPRP